VVFCPRRAGHAVDGVIDEEDGDVLTPVGGVQQVVGADRSQIAVPLVGDKDGIGIGPLGTGRHRRRPAVGGLEVAAVEIVVAENRTADRAHEDGALADAEVVHRLGDELVHHPVTAARAVGSGLLLDPRLAEELVIERFRPLQDLRLRCRVHDALPSAS
jgi:hypothetical protein